ncbi:MAG TPA: hypothetical protein VLA19_28880 [Herpetosiphonaceae bacterium]|nr:hypothetical protein [Herpetosiphonaceae bacterium]
MRGETRLALDTNKQPITNSSQQLCFFWTADIHTVRDFLLANEVELAGTIQDIDWERLLPDIQGSGQQPADGLPAQRLMCAPAMEGEDGDD